MIYAQPIDAPPKEPINSFLSKIINPGQKMKVEQMLKLGWAINGTNTVSEIIMKKNMDFKVIMKDGGSYAI